MEIIASIVTWANDNSGFLLAALTLVYCVATIAIVISSTRSNRLFEQQLKQSLELEAASRRPFLSLSTNVVNERGLPYAYLLLYNSGQTQARNVKVNLDPVPSAKITIGGVPRRRTPYFLTGEVFSVAPGDSLRDSLGFTTEIFKDFNPAIFEGCIVYEDILGNFYEEPAKLDFEIMKEAAMNTVK